MIDERIERYIESFLPPRQIEVERLEAHAKENQIPIMDRIGIESLLLLLKLLRPKRVLEIGTAIGYSAIRIAQALPEAVVVTIERDEERFKQAFTNIKALNLESRIRVLCGDALAMAKELEGERPFDVLFIDAAKGQYQRFFELYSPLVAPGGVIFSDNVLFRGLVSEETVPKRWQSLVKKIRHYNEWLMRQEGYETMILPVGDGLAVSIKNKASI